jgi:uncharacterized protein
MASPRRIVFHIGGPSYHPHPEQVECIRGWLGSDFIVEAYDGVTAFEQLDGCDLLVIMGMHWTGIGDERPGGLIYRPLEQRHKRAFEAYVAAGRPLLANHIGIGSYDDWPRFGELIGLRWNFGISGHPPIQVFPVRVLPTGHALVRDVADYTIYDELYYNLEIKPELPATVHATATWEDRPQPMVVSAEGGRIAGASRVVYLANGHNMRAYESPAFRRLWLNAIDWLLGGL